MRGALAGWCQFKQGVDFARIESRLQTVAGNVTRDSWAEIGFAGRAALPGEHGSGTGSVREFAAGVSDYKSAERIEIADEFELRFSKHLVSPQTATNEGSIACFFETGCELSESFDFHAACIRHTSEIDNGLANDCAKSLIEAGLSADQRGDDQIGLDTKLASRLFRADPDDRSTWQRHGESFDESLGQMRVFDCVVHDKVGPVAYLAETG